MPVMAPGGSYVRCLFARVHCIHYWTVNVNLYQEVGWLSSKGDRLTQV